MARTINLSIPHSLTQQEARDRIQKGITELRTAHASRLSRVEEQWIENHLDFNVHAVGQHVAGRLDVLPNEVKMSIDLPWMVALLAGKFVKEVETEGRKLLEKK